jgi:hypothetical protein
MKSGNFNLLEPSGPLQACNGTALPLSLPLPRTQTFVEFLWEGVEINTSEREGGRRDSLWLYFMDLVKGLHNKWGRKIHVSVPLVPLLALQMYFLSALQNLTPLQEGKEAELQIIILQLVHYDRGYVVVSHSATPPAYIAGTAANIV